MARYSQAFKQRAVARLLPPESSPVETVSREIGVSVDTLERWRSEALVKPETDRTWTAAARFEAVIATAVMDEAATGGGGRWSLRSLPLLNHTQHLLNPAKLPSLGTKRI